MRKIILVAVSILALSACANPEEDADYGYSEYYPEPTPTLEEGWSNIGREMQMRTIKVGDKDCVVISRYEEFKVACPGGGEVTP